MEQIEMNNSVSQARETAEEERKRRDKESFELAAGIFINILDNI